MIKILNKMSEMNTFLSTLKMNESIFLVLSLKTLRNEISGAKEITDFLDPRIVINSLAPIISGFSSVSGGKFS